MSTSTDDSSFALTDSFQNLPIELILRIIDILALDLRDSEPEHARSLFLVSRIVRQNLLPLLYEIHSTVVDAKHEFTGWDGRQYKNPAVSFFSWLLRTPSAQPRHHVKDLIFINNLPFRWAELQEDIFFIEVQAKPPLWWVDNLIVLEPWDAQYLAQAGLRAHTAQRLQSLVYSSTARDVITSAVRLWIKNRKARSYIRLCTQPAGNSLDPAQEGHWPAAAPASWEKAFLYHVLDPLRNYHVLEVPEARRGVYIFIDFGSSDGFCDLSVDLLDDISLISEHDSVVSFHVILVYPRGEKDIVIDGVVERLREHCSARVHERLWVVRSSTNRKLLAQNPHLEMARAFQQGIDPWVMGRRVSEFVPSDKREE